jgi:3-methyladenine DNA glycosylase AlkD
MEALERKSTKRDRDNLARFGITATRPFGVSMANLRGLAKQLGPSHDLAAALWITERYEARMLACLIDEPARVTAAQMDRWCRDFDNWAIADTACFYLFDRTAAAWTKVVAWSKRRDEFGKRAAFALLASLALHSPADAADQPFLNSLSIIEDAALDQRNFVKKAVNWALRAIGERNRILHTAACGVARRLAESHDGSARWLGTDASKQLQRPPVLKRLAAKAKKTEKAVKP